MTLHKIGGIAALFGAAAFLFGFAVFLTVLGPAQYGSAGVDPLGHIAFLAGNRPLMTFFNFVIYIA